MKKQGIFWWVIGNGNWRTMAEQVWRLLKEYLISYVNPIASGSVFLTKTM